MERKCCNCGKYLGLFNQKIYLLKDGYYCMDCMQQKGVDLEWFELRYGKEFSNLTCKEFSEIVDKEGKLRSEYVAKKKELRANFTTTNRITDQVLVDENNKTFKLGPTIYEFNQIVSYTLYEDNSTVMSGGIGRAVVGDLLFGGLGAIVGASTRSSKNICSNMEVVLTLKDEYHPTESIKLITNDIRRDSGEYKRAVQVARSIISKLDAITHENKETNDEEKTVVSVADEIRKFKGLLDDGIITQEEFDAKKKQLLNL